MLPQWELKVLDNHGVGNNQFANLSTMFYASYIFGEPIMSYILQRYPLGKSLGVCIVLWGVVVTCHSACSSYASLMIVRTLLGIFESSSAVGLILLVACIIINDNKLLGWVYGQSWLVQQLSLVGYYHLHSNIYMFKIQIMANIISCYWIDHNRFWFLSWFIYLTILILCGS